MGKHVIPEEDLQRDLDEFWRMQQETSPGGVRDGEGEEVASVQDLCRIFSVLDQVQDVLHETLGGLEPPHIIVLGAENSGKSTLLKRLCLMPLFPTSSKACTRMAVRLSIRRAAVQLEPTLEVWDVANDQRVGDIRTIPLSTGESAVTAEMDKILLELFGAVAGVSLTHELRISLVSPHLPPMNFIDLPGLVESPPLAKQQTRALADKHIAKHIGGSLLLVVLPADVNPNTSPVVAMVKDRKLEHCAVGVFTKCDLLGHNDDLEDFERLHHLLSGKAEDGVVEGSVQLEPYGYVATSNRRARATKVEGADSVLLRQARDEVRFFHEHGFEKEIQEGRATTRGLMNQINAMYLGYLRLSWMPQTVSRLLAELHACHGREVDLGLPASPGDLQGQPLTQLRAAAAEAGQDAAVTWVRSFFRRFAEEVLRPRRDELLELLQKVVEVPLGEEVQSLDNLLKEATACADGSAVADLEALATTSLGDLRAADCVPFKLQRFPGFVAQLSEALQGQVRQWEGLPARLAAFLRAALHPTSSPDLSLSYHLASEPHTVKIMLPVDRIVGGVLFLFSESVGRLTAEAIESTVGAVCEASFAAAAQEVEASHSERMQLQQRAADVEAAARRLLQLMRGDNGQLPPDAPVEQLAAELLLVRAEGGRGVAVAMDSPAEAGRGDIARGLATEEPPAEEPPLRWNRALHGPFAEISANGRLARRNNSLAEDWAVVVAARPSRSFSFRVVETSHYRGAVEVGFSEGLPASTLSLRCDASWLPRSWVFGGDGRFYHNGSSTGQWWAQQPALGIGALVRCEAFCDRLQVTVDGALVANQAVLMPEHLELYPVVGLYGQTAAVELVDA